MDTNDKAFPERDLTKPAEQQGIFRKFEVRRADGGDAPGGKHHGCRYFVLDLDHDAHAPDAMRAYAASCASTHPELAADISKEFGAPPVIAQRNPHAATFPAEIWLNVGNGGEHEVGPYQALSELSWCWESIDKFDVRYVRADLAATAPAAPVADPPQKPWHQVATVTMDGHQIREALNFLNPDGDAELDQLDEELTFGVVQHKDDGGTVSTGLCCWNDDTDGVYPLTGDGAYAPKATDPAAQPQPVAEQRVDDIVTALYRRFKGWSKRGFGPDDVTWCEVKADVMALIAASQQAAEPVARMVKYLQQRGRKGTITAYMPFDTELTNVARIIEDIPLYAAPAIQQPQDERAATHDAFSVLEDVFANGDAHYKVKISIDACNNVVIRYDDMDEVWSDELRAALAKKGG